MPVCVVYVVKEVASFRAARSINGLFYLKYIPKILQGPLKLKESIYNQNNTYKNNKNIFQK